MGCANSSDEFLQTEESMDYPHLGLSTLGKDELFKNYTYTKLSGKGSMGTVMFASSKHDPSVTVAIKVIDKKGLDGYGISCVKNEVENLQKTDHPYVCKFI